MGVLILRETAGLAGLLAMSALGLALAFPRTDWYGTAWIALTPLLLLIMAGLGLGVAELYAGFTFGAELQQFTVVGMLVAVLVWRQIQYSRHRQAVQ